MYTHISKYIWNRYPQSFDAFKKEIKKYLFQNFWTLQEDQGYKKEPIGTKKEVSESIYLSYLERGSLLHWFSHLRPGGAMTVTLRPKA